LKRFALLIFASALVSCSWAQQQYTRGIGVYPGDPSEYAGPTFVIDGSYRNLALHRPAYQSSAYDYNLTAQLITDGIREQASCRSGSSLPPAAAAFSRSSSAKSSSTATSLHRSTSRAIIPGSNSTSKAAGDPPELDRIDLWMRRMNGPLPATGWTYIVSGSDDHSHWTEVGRSTGTDWPSMKFSGPSFMQSIPFIAPAHNRYYRVELSADGIKTWGVAELATFDKGRKSTLPAPSTS
jgi:hypothetical protein